MKVAFLLVAALTLLGGSVAARDGSLGPRVRPVDRLAAQLLPVAVQWSATVRGLLAELERSDLIVMVSVAPPPPLPLAPQPYHGGVRLLAAAGGQRYVSVWVDAGWPPGGSVRRQVALLAHELQHAVELARHRQVSNQAAVAGLFNRLGRELGTNRFETEAALEIEGRVLQELSASASRWAAARPRLK